MAKYEVFPSPTVEQVLFRIHFPNLFYMESRIGEYQQLIVDRFPSSQKLVQRQFFMASVTQKPEDVEAPAPPNNLETQQVWNFTTEDGVLLSVVPNSLGIISTVHKTYNSPKEKTRFRDTIEYAVDNLLKVVKIPKFTRLGLRYIDTCPVLKQDNRTYKAWYKTAFPLTRFPLPDAIEMLFRARCRRKGHFLHYREFFQETAEGPTLKLDFDGYATHVPANQYLDVTDKLHKLIAAEYRASIKRPLLDYMRKPKRKRITRKPKKP